MWQIKQNNDVRLMAFNIKWLKLLDKELKKTKIQAWPIINIDTSLSKLDVTDQAKQRCKTHGI